MQLIKFDKEIMRLHLFCNCFTAYFYTRSLQRGLIVSIQSVGYICEHFIYMFIEHLSFQFCHDVQFYILPFSFHHVDFSYSGAVLLKNANALMSALQQNGMQQVQLGSHTVRSHGVVVVRTHMHDWLILMLLVLLEIILYIIHPFYRFVGKDMMTDLKYPLKSNTVPVWAVPVSLSDIIISMHSKICKFTDQKYFFPHPLLLVDDQMYAVLLPIATFLVLYYRRRDVYDLHHAILGD